MSSPGSMTGVQRVDAGDASRLDVRHLLRTFCCVHFSPYRMLIDRPTRTVVIINPKVGSTTFRRLILHGMREVRGMTHLSEGRWKPFSKARDFPIARFRDYMHALSHPGEYDFFCFVRNPYARLKSAWLNKLAFGHLDGYPRGTEGKRLNALRRFAGQRGLPGAEENSPIPFPTLLSFVEWDRVGRRDHHWDTQYSVLMMSSVHYTRIYQMETDFRPGIEEILTRLSLHDERVLRLLDEPANQSHRQVDNLYDQELADRVYAIYEPDFGALGYDRESWRGM